MRWFRHQFAKLLLVPAYFRVIAKEWMNILFGETLVGVVFLLWWALANPRNPPLILVFVAAMFVAGYYAWLVVHVRLVPKLEISEFSTQNTETFDATGARNGWAEYIQLVPKCLTEANVEECRGILTSIEMFDGHLNDWRTMEHETMLLEWSHGDAAPITLYPGAERRLNVFYMHSGNREIRPCVLPYPVRFLTMFNMLPLRQLSSVRLKIRVFAKDCPAINVVLRVDLGDDPLHPSMWLE